MAAASQAARLALILILAGCTFQLSLYLLRWFRHRARVATGAAPRPVDLSEVLARSRAFLRECGAFVMTMTVSLWRRQPPAPARTARRRPVILLHGYSLSAASFWMLTRRLRQDGWNWVWAINHRPLFGNIARNIDTLATAITHVRKVTGIDRVDIIAHSMGGLVTRAYLKQFGTSTVHRVITLGTPHRGTSHGVVGGWIDPMVRQMQVDSPFLGELAQDDRVPDETHFVSIYSMFDAVVVPPENAHYSGALNIQIEDVGHNSLLLSRRVYTLIRENLEAESAKDFLPSNGQV